MKKLFFIVIIFILVGCATRTEYGKCIGFFQKEDPKLEYHPSAYNISLAVVFSWVFLVPPIYVAIDSTYCPIGNK